MSNRQQQPARNNPARTDDLLASGAGREDGARGFDNDTGAESLETGMEGIATTTVGKGNLQSDSQESTGDTQTLTDKPGQLRNRQGS